MQLPESGRTGAPPQWPLQEQTPREHEVWAILWATPQAVAWERLGWMGTVARYCRLVVQAEPGASPTVHAQLTSLEDRLGLTPKAMRLLLWEIVPDGLGTVTTIGRSDIRARIKAVK